MASTTHPCSTSGCKRLVILFLAIGCMWHTATAQLTTYSPYSYYGIGNRWPASFSRNAGMAGVGVADANFFAQNNVNPAAAAVLAPFTMSVDFSGFAQFNTLKTESKDVNLNGYGINGLSLAFKRQKSFTVIAGLTPYSEVGYKWQDLYYVPDDTLNPFVTVSDSGQGGTTNLHFGAAFSVLKKKLSIGAQVQYLFGNIQRVYSTELGVSTPVTYRFMTSVRSWGMKLGAQYADTLVKSPRKLPLLYRVGATADFYIPQNIEQNIFLQTGSGSTLATDTLQLKDDVKITVPYTLGVGFGIEKPLKYSLSADFLIQDWSNFQLNSNNSLGLYWRLGVGGEWMPDYRAVRNYFKRIAYRAGLAYEQQYLNIRGHTLGSVQVSAGLGLPVPISFRTISRLNVGFSYTHRGTTADGLVMEDGWRIVLGISLCEEMFRPKKYD